MPVIFANLSGSRNSRNKGHAKKTGFTVYLAVHVDGKRHLALLDSGCELSLAPRNLVRKRQLRPSRHHVNAANSSPIGILGKTDIEFSVGGRMSIATVFVTPDVSELMS